MAESLERASHKSGMPPGSLIHVGESQDFNVRISLVDYSADSFESRTVDSIEALLPYRDKDTVTWVNVEGIHDVALIEAIGQKFSIHPLVLEDIMNTHQRPKMEDYEETLYIVIRRPLFDREALKVDYEQISLLILDGFIFTFREEVDGLFDPVVRRLRESKGRFRSSGYDYLAYTILDVVVDQFFLFQDAMDLVFEELEDELMTEPTPDTLKTIQRIKRELIFLRRGVTPLREMLSELLRSESPLIQERTKLYLRDVYDHAIRVTEAMESYRDLIAGMLDIYLSSVSNKLNETMKILTVFSTIFIPLTFITGIYGMNFDFMPELKWKWAYPSLWLIFIVVAGGLLVFFRRKRWL
jgi:magnesium transporter